jgi:hypothetical protein
MLLGSSALPLQGTTSITILGQGPIGSPVERHGWLALNAWRAAGQGQYSTVSK